MCLVSSVVCARPDGSCRGKRSAVEMNSTTIIKESVMTTTPTMSDSSETYNYTLIFFNSSTDHNSSDVTMAADGLDSLMNVFIALVLAVLILTTAIGK